MGLIPRFAILLGLIAGWWAAVARADDTGAAAEVVRLAKNSRCAAVRWADRGRAPSAYVQGVALVFARAACHPERADVGVASAAQHPAGLASDRTDALTWYRARFKDLGMSNLQSGPDTLRHAYTLLIGLGMRESSGKYCSGRDRSADFITADSAEAGLFQTSFGVSRTHPVLPELFQAYAADPHPCLLDVFSQGVTCGRHDAETFGTGDGADWQRLTKACPGFATDYAAVVIRTSGGSKGEFGPLRARAAEVRVECDAMLGQVQDAVRAGGSDFCDELDDLQ